MQLNDKFMIYDFNSFITYNEKFKDVILQCEDNECDIIFCLKINDLFNKIEVFVTYYIRNKEYIKNKIKESINEVLDFHNLNIQESNLEIYYNENFDIYILTIKLLIILNNRN